METASNHFESFIAEAGAYAATKAGLFKLKVADKTSDTVSDAASSLVVLLFVGAFLFCLSIGLALLIGVWTGKSYIGFFIVAGIYGIAGIVFHIYRKSLVKTPVSNFIINKFLNKPE